MFFIKNGSLKRRKIKKKDQDQKHVKFKNFVNDLRSSTCVYFSNDEFQYSDTAIEERTSPPRKPALKKYFFYATRVKKSFAFLRKKKKGPAAAIGQFSLSTCAAANHHALPASTTHPTFPNSLSARFKAPPRRC